MTSSKILLKTKDGFQIDSFLSKMERENKGYLCRRYYSPEDLLDKVTTGSIFDDDKEISVLMDLDSEGVKSIGASIPYMMESPVVLVQRKSIPKTKAYTNITVDFEVKKLESIKPSDCVRWVSATLRNRGVNFKKGVPERIVDAVGNDQYAILNEIDKLCTIAKDMDFDSENIDTYLSYSVKGNYFSFIDNLTHLRVKETMEDFNNIDPHSYYKFIGFIISQLERFYKISIYRSQNYTPEEIADIIGIPVFILKTKILTLYSFFPKVKLLKAIDLFLDLSIKLRSSRYSSKLLFESYLLKIFKL